jgi:hypothetical protein
MIVGVFKRRCISKFSLQKTVFVQLVFAKDGFYALGDNLSMSKKNFI